MLVWYLGLGLLYGGGCLLEHAHLFGGNMVLTVDLLYILRWTAATSGTSAEQRDLLFLSETDYMNY